MVLTVKHAKVSAIPDTGDATLVEPSDWNANHTLAGLGTGVETALGNTAGGIGGFALVGTTPPTGSAGGDLTGSYPNPTLAWVTRVAGKSLTLNNTLTLAGTDNSTLNIGAGGTLGTGAFAAAGITQLTGDVTAGPGSGSQAATLAWITRVAGKSLTLNNSLTLAGADSTTMTFPATSATIARTDAGQTFTGLQIFAAGLGISAGGNTSSFPAWKQVGATWSARLADDSGDASISVNSLTANGGILNTRININSTSSNVQIQSSILLGWTSGASNGTLDTMMGRAAAATLQLGAANAASPVAQTLQAQSVVAGNGNTAGANWTIQGSLSNGSGGSTGGGGDIILQTTASVAASGSQNSAAEAFRILSGTQTLKMATAKALAFASGTNQRAGNATLVAGTVTVANTTVTANTVVILTRKTSGGTIGTAITYTTSAATSFTITSDNILDTSTFSYMLLEVP